ncbi:MAG TPA: TolC family protein [Gemmataceae bacterium]|nr:TolC family protein [Gemmataceae bacterium]
MERALTTGVLRGILRVTAGALPWLALAGCVPVSGVWSLVVPEQRRLDVREPGDFPPAPIPPVPPPETVNHRVPQEVPSQELSLDQAIRIALANSQVVRVLAGGTAVSSGQTIYDPAISNTQIDQARAVFDPIINVNNAFSRSEVPQAAFDPTSPVGASITGTRIDNYDLGVGVTKRTVTGGTLALNFADNVARFNPNPSSLNPQSPSSLTLSYTQPLLQGAGIDVNVAPIMIARINTERSYFQLKDAVQELVRGVIEAYWAVVFARTDVWARRQQVEQGEFAYLLAEARKRQGLGTAGAEAQAKVALTNFKATLIASEANLLQREAALRNILGLPPTEPTRFTPDTAPTPTRVEPQWSEVIRLAEVRRPDLIELKLIIEADQQSLLVARNQALPRVDATALYRWNGLEGQTPTGAHMSSDPGQFTDWSLGVNFSVPLGLRQGRAGLRQAELILARDRANLQQGLHAALHQLAANMRNLAQFYEQYRAYQETRTAARINLQEQLGLYRSQMVRGQQPIFLNVLQAITDWGNAVSSEAQSLAQYNVELANLERQTGTILETHGVRFFEERFGSIGPLGRLAAPVCYPQAVVPSPNADRYPAAAEPAEAALDRERPSLQPTPVPVPEPPPLPPPKPLPPLLPPVERPQ